MYANLVFYFRQDMLKYYRCIILYTIYLCVYVCVHKADLNEII